MPRPRHPIREHFHEIDNSPRKNGAIGCNYCGKEQSAGNPKRCQKHLDECPQYAQVLAALEAGETAPFPYNSPYEGTSQNQNENSAQLASALSTPGGFQRLGNNNSFAVTTPGSSSTKNSPTLNERMSEDAITRALNINETTYLAMERELDAQMMILNLSGAGLHTSAGQKLLTQAFLQISEHWPEVMNELPEHDRKAALTSMAYVCNRKRRNGHPPNSSTPSASALQRKALLQAAQRPQTTATGSPMAPSLSSTGVQDPPQPFGLTTIIAERAEPNGPFVVCRPSDLIEEPKQPEDITVNDVKFMPFISLLQHDDDVLFNAADDDKIVFTFTGGRTKTVSNEIVWRVALEEMSRKGVNPFVFKIYKRQPGSAI